MTYQYWLHPKTKCPPSSLEFQKAWFVMFRSHHGFSPSSIKIDFKIDIWWFSNQLAKFSLWGKNQEMRTLDPWRSVTWHDWDQRSPWVTGLGPYSLLLTMQRVITCIMNIINSSELVTRRSWWKLLLFSSCCIWSIHCISLSYSPIFQRLWFISWFTW